MKQLVRGGTVVGFDGRTHVLIRDGMVAWEDDEIIYVGRDFPGEADEIIDASDRLIIPGLIDIHFHAGIRLNFRVISDHGDPQFFGCGYLNWQAQQQGLGVDETEESAQVGAALSLVELLTGGCTTVMEVGSTGLLLTHLRDQAEKLGISCRFWG